MRDDPIIANQTAVDRIAIDPVTVEIIRCGLLAITNEIDANICRTAYSPIVAEYKD